MNATEKYLLGWDAGGKVSRRGGVGTTIYLNIWAVRPEF